MGGIDAQRAVLSIKPKFISIRQLEVRFVQPCVKCSLYSEVYLQIPMNDFLLSLSNVRKQYLETFVQDAFLRKPLSRQIYAFVAHFQSLPAPPGDNNVVRDQRPQLGRILSNAGPYSGVRNVTSNADAATATVFFDGCGGVP